jgi:bacteriocin-like protein
MKMQELNNAELQEVNGGSIFGGNDSSASQSGLLGSIGIGNLFSGATASQNGDQATASSFSLGNGISTSLGSIFGKTSQSA